MIESPEGAGDQRRRSSPRNSGRNSERSMTNRVPSPATTVAVLSSASSTFTTNASLQPHLPPSNGRPMGDSARERPRSRNSEKALRASGGRRIHGAPEESSKASALNGVRQLNARSP